MSKSFQALQFDFEPLPPKFKSGLVIRSLTRRYKCRNIKYALLRSSAKKQKKNDVQEILREILEEEAREEATNVFKWEKEPVAREVVISKEESDNARTLAQELIPKLQVDTSIRPLLDIASAHDNINFLARVMEWLPHSYLLSLQSQLLNTSTATASSSTTTNAEDSAKQKALDRLREALNTDVIHTALARSEQLSHIRYLISMLDTNYNALTDSDTNITTPPAPDMSSMDAVQLSPVFKLTYSESGERMYVADESFRIRELDDVEKTHPVFHFANSYTTEADFKPGDRSTVETLAHFQENFEVLTGGLLNGVDLSAKSVVVGGSLIAASLTPYFGKAKEYRSLWEVFRRKLLDKIPLPADIRNMIIDKYIKNSCGLYLKWKKSFKEAILDGPYRGADIDLFFFADNQQDAEATILRVFKQITADSKPLIVRTPNTVTVYKSEDSLRVQLVVSSVFRRLDELMAFFDLDCTAIAYDGSQVYYVPRSRRAFNTRFNFVSPKLLKQNPDRVLKYAMRGFSALIFEPCKHNPRCDVVLDSSVVSVFSTMALPSAINDSGTGIRGRVFKYDEIRLPQSRREVEYFAKVTNCKALARAAREGKIGSSKYFLPPILYSEKLEDLWPTPKICLKIPENTNEEDYYYFYVNYSHFNDLEYPKITPTIAKELSPLPRSVKWRLQKVLESRKGDKYFTRCYMCLQRCGPNLASLDEPFQAKFTVCPSCTAINEKKWKEMVDLTGCVALVTGGRIKIGYYTALKLLRCGAIVIVTTRFPQSAARRFLSEPDGEELAKRLHIYGLDLRHVPSVQAFLNHVKHYYPKLDIIVNNAAQTIRRPPAYYADLVEKEMDVDSSLASVLRIVGTNPFKPLPAEFIVHGQIDSQHNFKLISHSPQNGSGDDTNKALSADLKLQAFIQACNSSTLDSHVSKSAAMAMMALDEGDEELRNYELYPKGKTDAHGEQLDLRTKHTWTYKIEDVSVVEVAEVTVVNSVAPFIIIQKLAPLMQKLKTNYSSQDSGDSNGPRSLPYSFIINVTSAEGSFSVKKTGEHPHTNMAKASLNMLTRTIAGEMLLKGIIVNAVDTGWVTSMLPVNNPRAIFIPPLSEQDGAARVLDPIISVLKNTGELVDTPPIHGALFKNFKPIPWN